MWLSELLTKYLHEGAKNMSTNSKIAELILRSQNASDGGKHMQYFSGCKKAIRDNCARYGQKDSLILSAIELIRGNNSSFVFSVQRDREYKAYYLVYFETRINGVKFQVSFHSFDGRLGRYVKNSRYARWDKKFSRDSAVSIYKYYCPNGQYTQEGGGSQEVEYF